jgi:hypothetical protein
MFALPTHTDPPQPKNLGQCDQNVLAIKMFAKSPEFEACLVFGLRQFFNIYAGFAPKA